MVSKLCHQKFSPLVSVTKGFSATLFTPLRMVSGSSDGTLSKVLSSRPSLLGVPDRSRYSTSLSRLSGLSLVVSTPERGPLETLLIFVGHHSFMWLFIYYRVAPFTTLYLSFLSRVPTNVFFVHPTHRNLHGWTYPRSLRFLWFLWSFKGTRPIPSTCTPGWVPGYVLSLHTPVCSGGP